MCTVILREMEASVRESQSIIGKFDVCSGVIWTNPDAGLAVLVPVRSILGEGVLDRRTGGGGG